MAALGTVSAWVAALFAAWAFTEGVLAGAQSRPPRAAAVHALLIVASASTIATATLLVLLNAGDVTVNYVARSITTNLTVGERAAAIWNLPSGAVLPTSAIVALAGTVAVVGARSGLSLAVVSGVVMSLMAASLAAAPFARLPWTPADGLGLVPGLRDVKTVIGRVALAGAAAAWVVVAATAARMHEDGGRKGIPPFVDRSLETANLARNAYALTSALLVIGMWTTARGEYIAGVASSPAPLSVWGGAIALALLGVSLAWSTRYAMGAPYFVASLGALGVIVSLIVGGGPPRDGASAQRVLLFLSFLVAGIAAMIAAATPASGYHTIGRTLSVVFLTIGGATVAWLASPLRSTLPAQAHWVLALGIVVGVMSSRAASFARDRLIRGVMALAGVTALAVGTVFLPSGSPTAAWGAVAAVAAVRMVAHIAHIARSLRSIANWGTAARAAGLMLAAVAVTGELLAPHAQLEIASGHRASLPRTFGVDLSLAHQGVSPFDEGSAHVVAVALEPSRAGASLPLMSPDRREYVDSRDEIVGPPTSRPAVITLRTSEMRVVVESIGRDQSVALEVSLVPLAFCWYLAIAAVVLGAVLDAASYYVSRVPSTSPRVDLA